MSGAPPEVPAHPTVVSVYGRLLGGAAAALDPRVRRLHLEGASSRAAGALRIRRGSSAPARVAAVLLGLPAAGDAVPTRLTISRHAAGERWIRHMGAGRPLTSTQHDTAAGVLVERYGLVALHLTLTAAGPGLRLASHGVRLQIRGMALPLPRRFAPAVCAEVQPDDCGGVWIAVQITAPLVGLLLHYEGHITVEQPAHA